MKMARVVLFAWKFCRGFEPDYNGKDMRNVYRLTFLNIFKYKKDNNRGIEKFMVLKLLEHRITRGPVFAM